MPGVDAVRVEKERSGWVERTLPNDFAGAGSVRSLGTLVLFQTPSAVHLWSAITAQWSVIPTSPSALVSQFNAYAIVEDGANVYGYSTRKGKVEVLQLGAAPFLHHGSASSAWLSIAELGNEVWSFGAFDGAWRSQTLAAPGPAVTISQSTALVDDGTTLYGISSYFGDFVPGPTPALASSGVAGDVGMTWDTAAASGFSALTNQWATHSFANGLLLLLTRGYTMFQDGNDMVAFSGSTGDFNSHTLTSSFSFNGGRYVGAASGGGQVVGYSAGQNSFATNTPQGGFGITVDSEVFMVQDTTGLVAFSVVTGAFSDKVLGNQTPLINDTMVWTDDGVDGYAFSAVSGNWSKALAFSSSQSTVDVLKNVVVLSDPQGYSAFSGRSGQWFRQDVVTPFQYSGPSSGDLLVAFDGAQSHVFDPVLSRWATITGTAAYQDSDIWRQTFVGYDGTHARGYGLMNNRWTSMPVDGNFIELDANSSSGFLLTSTHLYSYSAHGSLSTLSRFPEFSRLQPIGIPLRLIQSAPAGSSVINLYATSPAYITTHPFGTLFLKPSTIFRRTPVGVVPAGGLLESSIVLPNSPALRGISLHIQNLITAPSGVRWLTNSIAPVIL